MYYEKELELIKTINEISTPEEADAAIEAISDHFTKIQKLALQKQSDSLLQYCLLPDSVAGRSGPYIQPGKQQTKTTHCLERMSRIYKLQTKTEIRTQSPLMRTAKHKF